METICTEIHSSELFALIDLIVEEECLDYKEITKELITVTILSLPLEIFASVLPPETLKDFEKIHTIQTNSALGREVAFLRANYITISSFMKTNN